MNSLQILLVEDSDDNRLLVQLFLKNSGHTLTLAENGQEAVDLFKKQKFNLILMDIQMPVMDGYSATREIRKLESEKHLLPTPILAVTAHAFDEDVQACLAAGCNEHVPKPLKKARLNELLAKYGEPPVSK